MKEYPDIEGLISDIIDKKTSQVFVFAGAGSGKTYTVVQILKHLKGKFALQYQREGRHIAVITFTNNAVDEINSRIFYDPLFEVSTIHSFLWNVISISQYELKKAYIKVIEGDIVNYREKIVQSPRATSNRKKLEDTEKLLKEVSEVKRFSYNPLGNNHGIQALSHSDVIRIGALMLKENHKIQNFVCNKYPFLLIDESQDTNKEVVDSLFEMKKYCGEKFCLILVGDEKQRIYLDGKKILTKENKENSNSLTLRVNYRSGDRIVRLGNQIAKELEKDSELIPKPNAEIGYARLFISSVQDDFEKQLEVEYSVMKAMASYTEDRDWEEGRIKILILEHKLGARRLGFLDLYEKINSVESYKNGLIKGDLGVMGVFRNLILPIYDAINAEDDKSKNSLRLEIIKSKTRFKESLGSLQERRTHYVKGLKEIEKNLREDAPIKDILYIIKNSEIYSLPSDLKDAISAEKSIDDISEEAKAWREVIDLPISSIIKYFDYINNKTEYATHQGVKGMQFDRVLCNCPTA